jgi:hypothetical protein
MSAYLPSAQRRQRAAAPVGLVLYDGDGAESDYDYICNVSDDDVVERDIDAEIEARERFAQSVASVDRQRTPSQPQSRQQSMSKTMSQRMLSSLQQNRLKNSRLAASASSYTVSATRALEEKHAAPPVSMTRSASNAASDVMDTPLSRTSSSCTDRLEARISKSFLSRQESVGTDTDEPHDMSAFYSGRRTYPAESIKKSDPRLSDTGPTPSAVESKMMALLAKERATRNADAYFAEEPIPEREVLQPAKTAVNSGVSFHFYGGSSVRNPNASTRGPSLALTDGSSALNDDLPRVSRAVFMTERSQTQPAPAPVITHATLAKQLGDIESLVDGIESCMPVATFSSLAARVAGELELLRDSTKTIRSTGTTMILEEVGRQQTQTETAFALRRLVTRAVAVHKRIDELIVAVRQMVV